MPVHKAGKKNRKWNRNKAFCTIYRNEQRHEKGHIARLKTHLKRFPNDNTAIDALSRYKLIVR